MFDKLLQEIGAVRRLVLSIEEKDGHTVLTKDQILAVLNQYRRYLEFLHKLLEERQMLEFLLAEHRLNKLGVKKTGGYLN